MDVRRFLTRQEVEQAPSLAGSIFNESTWMHEHSTGAFWVCPECRSLVLHGEVDHLDNRLIHANSLHMTRALEEYDAPDREGYNARPKHHQSGPGGQR